MTLRHTPLSVRVFATTVLVTLGLGYALAMLFLYAREIKPSKDQGVGVVKGVAQTYHGVPGESALMASLKSSMSSMIEGEEFVAFSEWVDGGATEEGYAKVASIVEDNCASCHEEGGYSPLVTNYTEIKALPVDYERLGEYMEPMAKFLHDLFRL